MVSTSTRSGWFQRLRARGSLGTDILWRGSTLWSTAFVVAAYPFLYILDENTSAAFSPVLPGVTFLAITWMAAPFLLTEWFHRRWRNLEPDRQAAKLNQYKISGRNALMTAAAWFLAWLALGV